MNYVNFSDIRPLSWKLWYAYYTEATMAFCWILFPMSLILVDVYSASSIYSCPVVFGVLGTIYRLIAFISHLIHYSGSGVRLILVVNSITITPYLLLLIGSAVAFSVAPYNLIASGILLILAIGCLTILLHIHRPIYFILLGGVALQVSLSILLLCFKVQGVSMIAYLPYVACLTPAATASLTLLSSRKYLCMAISPSLVVRPT